MERAEPSGAPDLDPVGDSTRWTLVYDGACGLCTRSVAWVMERDRRGVIRAIPSQDPEVARRWPEVPATDFDEAMQLFSPGGEREEGAAAVGTLLGLLPRWGAAGWLLGLPGVRSVAARVYRWVARRRGRFGCGEHCSPGV